MYLLYDILFDEYFNLTSNGGQVKNNLICTEHFNGSLSYKWQIK